MTLHGKRPRDPALPVRRVFVWSSARGDAARANRARKLDRARDDLDRLHRGLGGRHYPDPDAVAARVGAIAASRRVKDYLRAQVDTDQAGKPTWPGRSTRRPGRRAGRRRLLRAADQPHPAQADAAEVLRRFTGQEVVERRYGTFKGPLAVAPLFLKSNRRIQALVTVICLALLLFCLVERQARRAIAPATMLNGLYVRRPAKPTGRLIFQALASLRLIPATQTDPPGIPRLPPLQARLMELLNVDPTQQR